MEEYKDEIMLEYKKNNFDFVDSKIIVNERHRQLEEMKNYNEMIQQNKKAEKFIAEKAQEAIEKYAPVEITVPKEIIPDEEIIKVSFTIETTKSNIVELKNWLKERNISYE